jgi:sortase A
VTTSSLESEDASERWSDVRIDAWILCGEFVQRIVSEARAGVEEDLPGDTPEVDWDRIWRAGAGAPSEEVAIGRIVRAASEAARGISAHPREAHSPSPPTHRSNGAAVLGVVPQASPPEIAADTVVPAETLASSARPGVVPVEPSAAPADQPPPAPAEPTASLAEPSTTPVSVATVVAGPETVAPPAPPEPPSTARIDVVPVEVAPIVRPALGEEPETDREVAPETVVTGPTAHVYSPWFQVFTWTRNVGAIILLFVVWQLWGTSISQHHAQSQLKSEFHALLAQHAAGSHASKSTLISATTRVPSPGDGSVVAEIQIPAIGVDQYVVEGTTESDLSKGPGHYTGTAMPGQAGNIAIAGHRTTHGAPFNGLGRVVPGERIVLTTTSGQNLTYVVSRTPQVVSPGDVEVLNYFGDNRITLTTCNPEFSASQRLVVVGMLKQPFAGPAVDVKHLSYHVVNPATASWNWSLLPAVGVEVCLLLLIALSYRRFGNWFEAVGKWLILVPLWAAGLYLLFNTLTDFLPSSL